MSRTVKDGLMITMGIAFLVLGAILLKVVEAPQGMMEVFPYICLGVGCGILGGGIGNMVGRKVLDKNPEAKKLKEIEEQDERNLVIGCRAKAKAYDMMVSVFGILTMVFAMMNVGIAPVLMLVCAYLFVVGYGIYYRVKYEKEM